MAETCFHYALCPEIIIDIGSAANLFNRFFRVIISYICLITAIFIRIKLRCHVSAAAPVFIAYTKEINLPRLFMSVFLSEVCHRRNTVECHIFNPLRHFLNRSASEVSVYICLTTYLTAEFHKLMCSKTVILNNSTPMSINHFLSCLFWSDSVFPMILISKASARPAKHRHFQFLECFNYICTHTVYIRDF